MKSLLLLIAAAAGALAQNTPSCNTATIPVCSMGSPSGDVQIKLQAVPTSTTSVAVTDAYLKEVRVVNTSGTALLFTLADRQGSPVQLMSTVSIAANTTYVIAFPSPLWMSGGFTVLASGAGLNISAAWRQ